MQPPSALSADNEGVRAYTEEAIRVWMLSCDETQGNWQNSQEQPQKATGEQVGAKPQSSAGGDQAAAMWCLNANCMSSALDLAPMTSMMRYL